MLKFVCYDVLQDYLLVYCNNDKTLKYKKPAINVFEYYDWMVYYPETNEAILAIGNEYNAKHLDWVLLEQIKE